MTSTLIPPEIVVNDSGGTARKRVDLAIYGQCQCCKDSFDIWCWVRPTDIPGVYHGRIEPQAFIRLEGAKIYHDKPTCKGRLLFYGIPMKLVIDGYIN